MTPTLYIEGSFDLQRGYAAWGAVLLADCGELQRSGPLGGGFGGSVTLMELAAVETAVLALRQLAGRTQPLTMAMRSTAALAVLRWVFPAAPFLGVEVMAPKRLKRSVQEFAPLYSLSDLLEGREVRLQLATPDCYTAAAYDLARGCMEEQRRSRSAAR